MDEPWMQPLAVVRGEKCKNGINRANHLPGAESHDAHHVPEVIEIVLGSGIQVVPQLEHVIWKETNKENCQAQLVGYPLKAIP